MNKIRWSQIEKDMIVDEIRRIRRLYPKKSHLSTVALVTEAQLILPKDRQRKLVNAQQVEWADKLRQQFKNEITAEQVAEKKPVTTKELETPNIHPIVSQLSDLLSDIIVQLVNESIQKAKVKLNLEPEINLDSIAHDIPIKPSILIYGLMPSQKHTVNNAIGDCFNVRYLKDAPTTVIKSNVERADTVYVMTKFIKHDEYNHLKKYPDKVVHVNGGVTELIRILEERYLYEASN